MTFLLVLPCKEISLCPELSSPPCFRIQDHHRGHSTGFLASYIVHQFKFSFGGDNVSWKQSWMNVKKDYYFMNTSAFCMIIKKISVIFRILIYWCSKTYTLRVLARELWNFSFFHNYNWIYTRLVSCLRQTIMLWFFFIKSLASCSFLMLSITSFLFWIIHPQLCTYNAKAPSHPSQDMWKSFLILFYFSISL